MDPSVFSPRAALVSCSFSPILLPCKWENPSDLKSQAAPNDAVVPTMTCWV